MTAAPRLVVTGGPGAGKTAVLELVRRMVCAHVRVLPESASIVYGGGFPREQEPGSKRAAQRAIFHVQRELEEVGLASGAALVLCDRGTIDGGAYWPGPGDLWPAVGTTLADERARYAAVIHLRVPPDAEGYDHRNPLRVESGAEARAIDERIAALWAGHPRRIEIAPSRDFLAKVHHALDAVTAELPDCCEWARRARLATGQRIGAPGA